MAKHVVAAVGDIPPGNRKLAQVNGRAIVVFNLGGEFFALNNRCPHRGGSLCQGKQTGLVESDGAGQYRYSRPGEIIRCPWHGWEFDIRTGQSWCDPSSRACASLSGLGAAGHASWWPGPMWRKRCRSAWRTITWWWRRNGRGLGDVEGAWNLGVGPIFNIRWRTKIEMGAAPRCGQQVAGYGHSLAVRGGYAIGPSEPPGWRPSLTSSVKCNDRSVASPRPGGEPVHRVTGGD